MKRHPRYPFPKYLGLALPAVNPAWRERTWALRRAKPLRCQDRDKAIYNG